MKILHVHENLAPMGGVETYLQSLMLRLTELGHEQAFAFAVGEPSLAPRAYRVSALNRSGRWAERDAARDTEALLSEWRPDVIHLHNVYNVGAVSACLDAAPVVVHGHDFRYLCPSSTMFYRRTAEICGRTCGPGCFTTTIRKHCLTPRPLTALRYYHRVRWMARQWGRFAHVIAPSQAALDRFLQAGLPPERGVVLPYYCPIETLDAPRPWPGQATILFLGRISAVKGYEYFVRALGLLPETVRGLMIGNFTPLNEARVRRLADEAGCGLRLQLQPWASREAISGIIQRATVLCFPSIWPETLGIVGLEALACGVPVVASDVGGVREWLLPDETGYLVPPRDAAALASGIQRILESPALGLQMGRRGIELMRQKFSPGGHVARLLAVYTGRSVP